jgi:hypothetical protein
MKSRAKPADRQARTHDEPRQCVSAEQCHRRNQHVTGFNDPRWETDFVRWCALCKRFVAGGRE